MSIVFRKLFVFLLVFFFLSPSASLATNAARGSNLVILSTCHKHAPHQSARGKSGLTGFSSRKKPISTASKREPSHRLLSKKSLRKKLSSKSAMIMDGRTGETLYAYSPDQQGQPASTIKVLTGIIAIDALRDTEMIQISRRAARMPRSKIYLETGKSYPANDLINAVLLASANDASVALAEKIGGSENEFAKKMTLKARSYGAWSTVCKTASGLTARGQKATVRDLALIFNNAMKNPEFARRMSRTKVKTRYGKVLRSHNKALWRIAGAEAGKTGYTRAARQTYVGSFKRGNVELIVAIMGSETMWGDIANLVEYGFAKKHQKEQAMATVAVATSSKYASLDISPLGQNRSLRVLTDYKKVSKF